MNNLQVLVATFIMSLAIFLTRLFPFLLFSRRDPPKILQFVADYLPPLAMASLTVYCLKDLHFNVAPYAIPQLVAISFCIVTYLLKHNAMISIFGGLIIFMILT